MTLNKEQLEILHHTVYRAAEGRYCGDSNEMRLLVGEGLMECIGRNSFAPDKYFIITTLGQKLLSEQYPGEVTSDDQDRVKAAAEDGTLSDLERTLDQEENTPITGGVNLDDDSEPEPAFRPEAVVDPMECFNDAMDELRSTGNHLPLCRASIRHARALVIVRKAMLAMETLHGEELAAAHRDRVRPTTEKALAAPAPNATLRRMLYRGDLENTKLRAELDALTKPVPT